MKVYKHPRHIPPNICFIPVTHLQTKCLCRCGNFASPKHRYVKGHAKYIRTAAMRYNMSIAQRKKAPASIATRSRIATASKKNWEHELSDIQSVLDKILVFSA